MPTITLILTSILCFTLSMCSSSKKENMEALNATQSADTSEAPSLPTPPPPIAPGTAHITATVLSAEETETGYHCVLRVEKVHKYGSSTPPLAPGADVKMLVASHIIESMDASSVETIMAPDNTLDLTVKHTAMAQMLGGDAPEWQVASIKQ